MKPLTEGTAKFLGLLVRPGAEQVGEWIGDRIQIARHQNIEKVVSKAKAKLDADGTEPRPIPTKILFPIIDKCSVEDEEDMIDRWANLLAASASGVNVPPSYVQTLATLSPAEARLLDLISRRQAFLESFPAHYVVQQTALKEESKLPDVEYRRVILSLFQLGLVRRVPEKQALEYPTVANMPIFSALLVATTDFADDFLAVCSPKSR